MFSRWQWWSGQSQPFGRRDVYGVCTDWKVTKIIITVRTRRHLARDGVTVQLDARAGDAAKVPSIERYEVLFDTSNVPEDAHATRWPRDLPQECKIGRSRCRQLGTAAHARRQLTVGSRRCVHDVPLADTKGVATIDTILRRRFDGDVVGFHPSAALVDIEANRQRPGPFRDWLNVAHSSCEDGRDAPINGAHCRGRRAGASIRASGVRGSEEDNSQEQCTVHAYTLTPYRRIWLDRAGRSGSASPPPRSWSECADAAAYERRPAKARLEFECGLRAKR